MVQTLHWSFSQTGHNILENYRHHLDYMIFKYRKQNYSLFQVDFSHIAEGDKIRNNVIEPNISQCFLQCLIISIGL